MCVNYQIHHLCNDMFSFVILLLVHIESCCDLKGVCDIVIDALPLSQWVDGLIMSYVVRILGLIRLHNTATVAIMDTSTISN